MRFLPDLLVQTWQRHGQTYWSKENRNFKMVFATLACQIKEIPYALRLYFMTLQSGGVSSIESV